ncbi:substrate-binding periplasmic protein [Rugamonas rubra]|uniref:Polar amino acid transport system substrate-binding protein n=1 Tax=Rugamonas rubra TaxID=758825 RepID=A0A1I4NVS2_9BURK|nr:transporter substrate-binding domain-containing protein [Rugamonas rubra]SFM19420.1 polar amino acid transport system substrate-binding protein [Rugamonas rubra]
MFKHLLVCGLLLCPLGAVRAGPAECGDIALAYYELGALYYRGPDGHWTGIDKDVVDELARRTGCRFQTTLESRVRIWSQLASGKLDMSVSGIATPEREKFAQFIPYFKTRNYLLLEGTLPPEAATPEGFLAQASYKVAVVKSFRHGGDYDIWIDKLRAQGRVHEAADFRAVVRLLKIGRVQAILALPTSWVPMLRQEALSDKVRVLDWSPRNSVPHGLVLARARIPEPIAGRLVKAIQAMHDDGTLLAIFRRHIGAELASELLID